MCSLSTKVYWVAWLLVGLLKVCFQILLLLVRAGVGGSRLLFIPSSPFSEARLREADISPVLSRTAGFSPETARRRMFGMSLITCSLHISSPVQPCSPNCGIARILNPLLSSIQSPSLPPNTRINTTQKQPNISFNVPSPSPLSNQAAPASHPPSASASSTPPSAAAS